MTDIASLTTGELLRLYGGILDELRSRGVVRSRNAPAGDLAETLATIVYSGTLAPQSEKSWDVLSEDGTKIQVKCRVLASGQAGAFSPFRSDGFDLCVFLVLDPSYGIVSATEVPVSEVYAIARAVAWVNGVRVSSTQDLLARPGAVDRTAAFTSAMTVVESATAASPIAATPPGGHP